ncbi:MAG: 3-deoxy-D-manno-octulosonic acid transferase [Candidatus Omnitrophota bacterium]
MRALYDIFFVFFSIVYIPGLLFGRKMHRGFIQRFGILPGGLTGPEDRPLWIHAVSVGEAAVAAKIAARFKKMMPGIKILVSVTTRTGYNMALKAGKNDIDGVFYSPLDISAVVSRVVRKINPRAYIMIETELWPNILEQMRLRGVPVALVNGRISDHSFRNYMKIKFLTRRILGCIGCFCMQSDDDACRIKELGAPKAGVFVTGNVKFDETPLSTESRVFDKKTFGFNENEEVFVAGSTHFPEERVLIGVYKKLRDKYPGLKFILAPRHIERASGIREHFLKEGVKCRYLSEILAGAGKRAEGCDVVLVDTIGHLKTLYSMASVVFIGGSLAGKGGQNPIEAAVWGKPVVFGPNMQNFREIARVFTESGAAVKINDAGELGTVLDGILGDAGKKTLMAKASAEVIEKNSGALGRTVDRIKCFLGL